METNTTLITVDMKELAIAKDEAGNFIVTPKAEEALRKLLDLQLLIESALDYAKDQLGQMMAKENLIKVQGGKLSVGKRFYGERFEIIDPQAVLGQGLGFEEKRIKLDTKLIDPYIKQHEGQLPEGIKLRDRVETVTISLRKEDSNGDDKS